jgi:hypothetical protein
MVYTLDIQRDVDTIEDVKGLVAPDGRHEHVVTILTELSQQARS